MCICIRSLVAAEKCERMCAHTKKSVKPNANPCAKRAMWIKTLNETKKKNNKKLSTKVENLEYIKHALRPTLFRSRAKQASHRTLFFYFLFFLSHIHIHSWEKVYALCRSIDLVGTVPHYINTRLWGLKCYSLNVVHSQQTKRKCLFKRKMPRGSWKVGGRCQRTIMEPNR